MASRYEQVLSASAATVVVEAHNCTDALLLQCAALLNRKWPRSTEARYELWECQGLRTACGVDVSRAIELHGAAVADSIHSGCLRYEHRPRSYHARYYSCGDWESSVRSRL